MENQAANTADSLPAGSVSHFRRTLLLLIVAPTLFLLVLTVVSCLARFWWRAEQFCHFRLQYGWLLLIALIGLCWLRQRGWGIAAGLGAAINFAFVLPLYWPVDAAPAPGKPWKLISYNVLSSNEEYADVLEMLRQERADVVLLCEVNDAWARQAEMLTDIYPHQHVVSQNNNFGIALFSRVPWDNVRTLEFGVNGTPSIVAEFSRLGPQAFTLIGTHPLPPGSSQAAAWRNEQLQDLERLANATKTPVIVVGDLNITSYSPYFHDLLRNAKLRDSRQGFGVQASWSARVPLLLTIPIDHCLTSPSFEILSRRVGRSLGSDHRPVIVTLRGSP